MSGGVGPHWPEAPSGGQQVKSVVGGKQVVTSDGPGFPESGGNGR